MKILATVLLGPGAEDAVADAITSVKGCVDGFVLIDSGGGPRALDAAVQAASPMEMLLTSYRWEGDYGAARQFAFESARAFGATHALTLDPDERLADTETIRPIVEAHPETEVFIAQDRDAHYFKERILKCSADLRWQGRVCEFLLGMTRPQVKLRGKFWELKKDEAGYVRRFERGVTECRRMIAEGDDRFRWRRHLGTCLMGLGHREEAIAEYRKALELAQADEDAAWMKYLLIEQLVMDQQYDQALHQAAVALAKHCGFMLEFGWIIAYCELQAGNYQNASRWAQMALQWPEDKTRVSFRGLNARKGCQDVLDFVHRPRSQEEAPFELEDFHRRKAYLPNFRRLGKALVDVLQPSSHLDLGAGAGLLVEAVLDAGCASAGIELAETARAATREDVRPYMRFGAGIDAWPAAEPRDLVSCVEVLEHVPPEQADSAVDAICSASSRWVYFSAAAPGQPGKGHVNCQPKEYWREKFEARGFRLAEAETDAFVQKVRDLQPCWWLPRNAMIFQRAA
jgi:tetratricopeptide (TPR) repeat protein